MAHQAGTYPVLDGMLVHRRVTPALNSLVYFAREDNTMWPELKPRPLDRQPSTLTIRPPHLPQPFDIPSV